MTNTATALMIVQKQNNANTKNMQDVRKSEKVLNGKPEGHALNMWELLAMDKDDRREFADVGSFAEICGFEEVIKMIRQGVCKQMEKLEYKCDICHNFKTHKNMYNDNICNNCYDKMEQ